MRKTIITIVGIMVALFSMVACQDYSAEEKLVEATFVPTSNKAINQSADYDFGADTDVDSYYWTYYCATEVPTASSEFKRFSNTVPAQKGLGVIRNLVKGEYYYFGIRGYSDEDYKNLIWEGYTGLEGNAEDDYEKVQLLARNTLVTIHVFTSGQGVLSFDIDASLETGYEESPAFKIDFQKVGELTTSTMYVEAGTEGFTNDGSTIAYKASMSYPNGTYFVTVSQMYKEGTSYEQVPDRKQVLILNIANLYVTLLSGSLDSTTGLKETFYYEADGWNAETNPNNNMHVIFHRAFEADIDYMDSKVDGLEFDVQDNGTVYTGDGDSTYFKPEPTKDSTVSVDWYINGVSVDDSACVLKCYDYVKGQQISTEESYLVRSGNMLKFYRANGDRKIYLLSSINQGNEQTAESVVISLHYGRSYIITYQVSEWNKEYGTSIEVATKYFLYNTYDTYTFQTPMITGVPCTEGAWQTAYGLNYQYSYDFGETFKFGETRGVNGDMTLYYFVGSGDKSDYYGF